MSQAGHGARANGLRVVPVTDFRALEAVAEDWGALLSRSVSNRPTQSPLWLLAWWRVFGAHQGRKVASALVYDGSRLIGMAPLLRRVWWYLHAVPYRRLELLGTGEDEQDEIGSEYVGVIAEPGSEEGVAEALAETIARGQLGPFDHVVLSALDGDLAMNAALALAFEARGMAVRREAVSAAPYIRLPATWEAYLEGLSRSGRYTIRRSLRAFEEWAGADTEFVRVSSASELEEGKRILVRLHEQRWRAAGKSGVFASRLFQSFHDAVLPHLIAKDALELVWLTARGAPVAVAYNIVWDNKVLFYQGGRIVDLPQKIRPGIVLHAHGIRKAIEAGRSEYDFLAGAKAYKVQMSNDSRPVTRLLATKAPMRDRVCETIQSGITFLRGKLGPARR